LKLDIEKRRQLVEMITDAAMSVSANSTLLNSIPDLMPEIYKFVPERVALLRKKLSVFEQTLNKEQRSWNEYSSLMRRGSPEDMIAGSLKADDDQQRMLRQQAIAVAILRRRADALRDFIKNEIEDDSLQRSLMDDLDTQQITAATVRGDADELRTLLPRVRRTEERARAMAEIAVVLEKKGDHDEAVRLLDEARTLIKVDFESETQSNALLALVAAYALVEPPKAFAIIERTIDRANDQIARALLLDKIARSGVVKNGELLMQNSGTISPEYMLFRYGKAVIALANADFNRTRAAADRFERMELRLMMRLLLAQSLLEDGRRTK
jgi:tetratricopeptide (TPR) repeat protein